MASCIYILTDGLNTKIGITNDLAKRISSYVTHNPNFQVYKTYEVEDNEARRVETAIKLIYKDKLSGQSKEWFEVSPDYIDRYVSILVQSYFEEHLTPAMHGVRLSNEAYELKEKITAATKGKEKVSSEEFYAGKERLAEAFAKAFGLGIPQHKLPENIVIKDGLTVDFNHCNQNSDAVHKAVTNNFIQIPHEDHNYRFYHLVKLSSGYYVALCTAEVSMPYLKAIEGCKQEMIEAANQVGWYTTFHDDWSWHAPDETALVLFQQKTPVLERLRSWNNSFRKWVIERSELLKQEKYPKPEKLEKTIEDIVRDSTFPMKARSYKELFDSYIGIYWCDPEYDNFTFREEYQFLFGKWAR